MSIKNYWQQEAGDLEGRILAILKVETAESGYLTSFNIAQSLKINHSPAIYEALHSLCGQGLVTESPKGSERFRIKREKPRTEVSSFTVICFCDVCGMEVYRHSNIKMRTEKKLQLIKGQSQWAFTKHIRRLKHTGSKLSEWWVNELWGDEKWGIPGKEPRPADDTYSASHFAEVAGILPEPWH